MPMKSFDEGTVAHLDVAVGDEVALGQRVLVLAKKGEDPKQVAASLQGGGKSAPAEPKATPAPAAKAPEPDEERPTRRGSRRGADQHADDARTVDRREQRPGGPTASPAPVHQDAAAGADGGGRVKSSPLARKIAAAARVDLRQVQGSGPGGRVVRHDVEAFVEARRRRPEGRARSPRPPRRPLAAGRIPHTRMRKTIAQRMVQAKQEAPEIHVTVDIRVDEIVAIRERLNKQLAAEKIKLSLGDFVTKAVALALRRHPAVNASFEPDAIVDAPRGQRRHRRRHRGGPDRPRPAQRRHARPARDPDHERGPGRGRPQGQAHRRADDRRDLHDQQPRHVRRPPVRRHPEPPRGRHPRRRRRPRSGRSSSATRSPSAR